MLWGGRPYVECEGETTWIPCKDYRAAQELKRLLREHEILVSEMRFGEFTGWDGKKEISWAAEIAVYTPELGISLSPKELQEFLEIVIKWPPLQETGNA